METLPFRILLKENDWVLRKQAAQMLYESRRPESRALLQDSLSHPDERIRLFAAQAIEKISERLMRTVDKLREEVKKRPDDANLRQDFSRKLGDLGLLFSESKQTQDHIFREAADELIVLLRIFPTRQDLLLDLAEVYWKWNRLAESDQILQKIKKDVPEFIHASFRRAEIAMKQNRPEHIRPLLDKIRAQPLPPHIRDAVRYWLE